MNKMVLAALGAVDVGLCRARPLRRTIRSRAAIIWTVAEITIDDGHFGDYADHLAGAYRKSMDFSKSKGWMKNSYHPRQRQQARRRARSLSRHDQRPRHDPGRGRSRAKRSSNAYLATTARDQDKQSGARAKYRKLGGNMLLQELLYKK